MTNLLANWDQILKFARDYGLPAEQKRAVIREFIQTKIISVLYTQKTSQKLFFVGGTALRLLHGLDRFSEDLDFDATELTTSDVENLLVYAESALKKENYEFSFYKNRTSRKNYYEFRFSDVLDQNEKLVIKFDFESFWQGQTAKSVLFNRYGVLANVMTKTLDQFVVEKLVAYLNRKQTLARDLYDLVWLAAQGAKPDKQFAKINGFGLEKLIEEAKLKFKKEDINYLEKSLSRFLLNLSSQNKITFFDKLY